MAYLFYWTGTFSGSSTDRGHYQVPTSGTLLVLAGSLEAALEIFRRHFAWRGNQIVGTLVQKIERIPADKIAVQENLQFDSSHVLAEAR